jgi:hypothetical protein
MIRNTFKFDFSELKLNVTQIEQVLGYKEGESHETIAEMISDLLKEAEKICLIKAEYSVFQNVKFINADKSVEINHISFNVNKIIYGQLKNAESIAVFLCTAGPEIGIKSRNAMKDGDLLTGYVYDVIGSEIVEAAADIMQNELELVQTAGGKKITNRYSPGYCNWDVAEQHKLFRLMPDNYCGIIINSSALMNPEKSVSGFIGIGEHVRHNPYTCSLCEMKDCIYRRVKAG